MLNRPKQGRGSAPRAALVTLAMAALIAPGQASAQDVDQVIPGVRLGLVYENAFQPALAIQPFTGRFGGEAAASSVEAILGRDLGNSDRFLVIDSLPSSLGSTGAVDYALWDRMGATYLLKGTVEGSGAGYVLVLEVHDVLYRNVAHSGSFRIPDPNSRDFRMAVHRASDEIVKWIFQEPGMAASRITFSLMRDDGNREIYVVDSDGENLQRVSNHGDIALSPAWSPDYTRIAYMTYNDDGQRIYEHDLTTGQTRLIDPGISGNHITPEYTPDGQSLIISVLAGARTGLYSWNIRDNCCLTNLTEGRWDDTNPTTSPDGRTMAFVSNRLGTAIPQIYTMPTRGGQPELLSPYEYGSRGYFTTPDWAPFGNNVAFSGRVTRSGRFNILVARMGEGRRLLQLTQEGNNEDPSWAPDGRHIVFVGERSWGSGLFVVDAGTNRIRVVLRGMDVGEPDWSGGM